MEFTYGDLFNYSILPTMSLHKHDLCLAARILWTRRACDTTYLGRFRTDRRYSTQSEVLSYGKTCFVVKTTRQRSDKMFVGYVFCAWLASLICLLEVKSARIHGGQGDSIQPSMTFQWLILVSMPGHYSVAVWTPVRQAWTLRMAFAVQHTSFKRRNAIKKCTIVACNSYSYLTRLTFEASYIELFSRVTSKRKLLFRWFTGDSNSALLLVLLLGIRERVILITTIHQ